VVRLKLVGSSSRAKPVGFEELPGKSNYFIGSDPSRWRTNVPLYGKVRYRQVYPGIDLVYYGNQGQLEYDWIVAPGADAGSIRMAVEGAGEMKADEGGDVVVRVGEGEVRLKKPVVYQEGGSGRNEVAGRFAIRDGSEIGFELGTYDRRRPLVIDPVLVYSTYHGGNGQDIGYGIAVDVAGNAYVTGETGSTDFPVASPRQPASGGGMDAFVTKLNASGSALVYSTYHGGSGDDVGHGIAVDGAGNAYVTGETRSTNFPTASPRQPAFGGGTHDAFVTKLNASGSALVYSTYHGGNGVDRGKEIAVDGAGNAYVTGVTGSTDFPMANPLQPAYGGGADAFLTKLNASGSALVYSTYHGGSGGDLGHGIAVDPAGNAYVTGETSSTDFPTANPRQPASGGGMDAFVTKLNTSGSALVYSTYHGGSGGDVGHGIAVDGAGNAYVTGETSSTNFPTASPRQPIFGGGLRDAFVTKLNALGSALVYSTYHGGSGGDLGHGIAVDPAGNAYVTGETTSTNFPTANPPQPAYGGGNDAFVTKLNALGSALVYSTYNGGSGGDVGHGIAVDGAGNAYVTGYTGSPNFPMANPLQPAFGGGNTDAFVTKIGEPPPILEITMSAATYVNGATVTATEFRLKNLGSEAVEVELGVWLGIPGISPISILNLGADGSVTIASGFDQNLGPVSLFLVDASFPRGNYEFGSRLVDPVTKKFMSEDLNPFAIE
jgi:hypothetical protein